MGGVLIGEEFLEKVYLTKTSIMMIEIQPDKE